MQGCHFHESQQPCTYYHPPHLPRPASEQPQCCSRGSPPWHTQSWNTFLLPAGLRGWPNLWRASCGQNAWESQIQRSCSTWQHLSTWEVGGVAFGGVPEHYSIQLHYEWQHSGERVLVQCAYKVYTLREVLKPLYRKHKVYTWASQVDLV